MGTCRDHEKKQAGPPVLKCEVTGTEPVKDYLPHMAVSYIHREFLCSYYSKKACMILIRRNGLATHVQGHIGLGELVR